MDPCGSGGKTTTGCGTSKQAESLDRGDDTSAWIGPKNSVPYKLYLTQELDESIIVKLQQQAKVVASDESYELNLSFHRKHKCICFGSLSVHNNIEEEWLLIYVLYNLSKMNDHLVVSVQDDDGEILLIVAADHLPDWLDTKNSLNRAYLFKGKIHIMPEDIMIDDILSRLAVKKSCKWSKGWAAAKFVRDLNASMTSDAAFISDNRSMIDSSQYNHEDYCKFIKDCGKICRTEAVQAVQKAVVQHMSGMPDKQSWIKNKMMQLDRIIKDELDVDLSERAEERLSLAEIKAMPEDDLETSDIDSSGSTDD